MSKLLTQKEACKYLNVSRTTILRWEKEGKITPLRTSGKHRRYPIEDLDRLLGNTYMKYGNKTMNCLIYARVSTKKQEEKELNEEMVEDMISIITSFSARIYGKEEEKK